MTTQKIAYAASATVTIGLATTPLASSPTFVIGRQSAVVDNTTNLYDDALLAGKVSVGASPAASTNIIVYVYAVSNDTPTYPDVMTGSDGDVTLTSVGVGQAFLKQAAAMNVDATTSNRAYPFGPVSVAQLFGGIMPNKWGVWITQNTGAALNSTAGNHFVSYTGITYTSA